MKWVKSFGYKETIRLEEKNVGSLGKKCYYKKDIKYLFRAHPNFFGQKKRISKSQVLCQIYSLNSQIMVIFSISSYFEWEIL